MLRRFATVTAALVVLAGPALALAPAASASEQRASGAYQCLFVWSPVGYHWWCR